MLNIKKNKINKCILIFEIFAVLQIIKHKRMEILLFLNENWHEQKAMYSIVLKKITNSPWNNV